MELYVGWLSQILHSDAHPGIRHGWTIWNAVPFLSRCNS